MTNFMKNKKKTKIEPVEAVAKIKILLNRYYERLGREEESDNPIDLVEDIEEVINKTNIPVKNLVLEDFEDDYKEDN